ncbi:hypothetical protein PNA2_0808 [Pyrococcus sp. NA2]|nr:hypothetical protein PNA2_0808 [Pyrococcus sp. NA2]
MEERIVLAIDDTGITIVKVSGNYEELAKFDLGELVDIIQYRYATPWNVSKDTLEKLHLILGEILESYSKDPNIKKDEVVRRIKLRIHENINK